MSSKTVLTLEAELYKSFSIDANAFMEMIQILILMFHDFFVCLFFFLNQGRGKATPKRRGWGGELFIRVYIHFLI